MSRPPILGTAGPTPFQAPPRVRGAARRLGFALGGPLPSPPAVAVRPGVREEASDEQPPAQRLQQSTAREFELSFFTRKDVENIAHDRSSKTTAARLIAAPIRGYPPHRQTLPSMCSTIWPSVGLEVL